MTIRIHRLLLRPAIKRQIICACALLPVLIVIRIAARWIHFMGRADQGELHVLLGIAFLTAAIKVGVFGWFRVLQSWNRYVTFHDLVVLVAASTTGAMLAAAARSLAFDVTPIAIGALLFDWLATIVVLGGVRSLGRFLAERPSMRQAAPEAKSVLIVGADHCGESLLRAIRANGRIPYRVVGFIGEGDESQGTLIGGVPVLGAVRDTFRLARRHGVDEVLIAAGRLSGRMVRDLLEMGRRRGIPVRMLPSYEQLLTGQLAVAPRAVSIEDLLRRDPVELDLAGLHEWIDGRIVLITGSCGSIGSEICRQLLQFSPRRLVLVDRCETGQFFLERRLRELKPDASLEVCLADVSDAVRIRSLFSHHRPEIVFHAAAYKHVPLLEHNAGEAVKNIVGTTRLLANIACESGAASFVLISTDKAVNPSSIMGCCKRVAELYVTTLAAESHTRFMAVRFGNVLGSSGSVVPIFREQIAAGGPITVTHPDMMRYFMTIPEAAQLVLQAGMMGRGGETFVLDMGEPSRIVDLARDMVRLSGLRLGEDIELKFVGVRPGEKLYEELVLDTEGHLPTPHSKIMIVKAECCRDRLLGAKIDRLVRLADGPPQLIVDELKGLVPAFQRGTHDATTPMRRAA